MKAYSGKLLGSVIDLESGAGTYTYLGNLYAANKGIIAYEGTHDGKQRVTVKIPD